MKPATSLPLLLLALCCLGGALGCPWAGHCAGASCNTNDDCSDVLVCVSGACSSGGTPAPTPKPTAKPTRAPTRAPTPAPTASCAWIGHCLGAACSTDNDCSDVLVCAAGKCSNGGTPAPTPATPTPKPTPAPTPSGGAGVIGRFIWPKWGSGQQGSAPKGINLGIAFTGEISPSSAVSESAALQLPAGSTRFISLGGGDATGAWTASALSAISSAIGSGKFSGYAGICYDIEEGAAGLFPAFQASFQTAKAKGFQVMVTVSHSAPYGFSDGVSLMTQLLASSSIDYMVPQLYSGGALSDLELDAGYTGPGQAVNYPWSNWSKCKSKVVPVIPNANDASQVSKTKSLFSGIGISTAGIIQWQ